MSLDPPTYLNSLQKNTRARPIPWEGAVRAGTISEQALKRIKAVDKVRKEVRKKTLEENQAAYKQLFLGGDGGGGGGGSDDGQKSVLEAAAKRPDVVQYILVLAGDLMNDSPSFTAELLEHPDPYKPFTPLLSHSPNPEEPIPLLASSVLSTMISAAQAKSTTAKPSSSSSLADKTNEALPRLFEYLAALTRSQDSGLQDIAVQEYASVLRSGKSRELFWAARKKTAGPLVDVLRAAAGVGSGRDADAESTLWSGNTSIRAGEGAISGGVGIQLLYHVLLVVWLLSFEGETLGQELEDEQQIIPLYVQLLRVSPKEKTTRLLLSTLRNLLSANRDALLPVAVSASLPGLLENLKSRHLTDPDLLEDAESLTEMLREYTSAQTTFDEYASEVLAGRLRWSPPHRSATFWTENAARIAEENGAQLPRRLAEILLGGGSSSSNNNKTGPDGEGDSRGGGGGSVDKTVLAVACNDVGWLVKLVPEKRGLLEKLGIKARVMELMGEPDEAVRWESLRAVGEWLRYSVN